MVDNSFQFVLFIVFNRTEPLQYLLFLSFLKRFWRSRRKASLWWLKASFDTTLLWFLAEILLWMCLWISWISCCEASFCCFCDIQWVWLLMLVLELLDFLLHCCVLLSNFLCGLFFYLTTHFLKGYFVVDLFLYVLKFIIEHLMLLVYGFTFCFNLIKVNGHGYVFQAFVKFVATECEFYSSAPH